jgi:hypothetical protein
MVKSKFAARYDGIKGNHTTKEATCREIASEFAAAKNLSDTAQTYLNIC